MAVEALFGCGHERNSLRMLHAPRQRFWRWLLVLVACGCTYPPPPGVIRFDPRNPPRSVKGPIELNFGSYDAYWEALVAACPVVISMPGGNAGRKDSMGFPERWRVSREYCSWLYYTPDQKYEMSMLVEGPPQPPDEQGVRRCKLPVFVEDERYSKGSLKYVYIIHNHPEFPTAISEFDFGMLALARKIHGESVETREGRIPIGIVAYFAKSYDPAPTRCEGFLEYKFGSNEVLKWTPNDQGQWHSEVAGTVTWTSETEAHFSPMKIE
ncbi:MAG TPA: hypothetical protein VNA24_35020 [Hyalangium sp.]|nr:hypothetical protein [Hyalangium sp.]